MTDQEVFDKTARHLIKQGVAAVEGSKCCLRTSDGLSCAVGCHIPDELYDPRMEYCCVSGVVPPELLQHTDLLRQLQVAHDQFLTLDMDSWKGRMLQVAQIHNLCPKVLEENLDGSEN